MNTYLIDGIEFRLKTDLTLDESDKASKLLSGLYVQSRNVLAVNISSKQVKDFLKIVLEPVKKSLLIKLRIKFSIWFNYGNIKDSVQQEIFKDFFLSRLLKAANTAEEFPDLIKQQLKLSNKLKH